VGDVVNYDTALVGNSPLGNIPRAINVVKQ
jgi:hypothetical protein